MTAPIPGGNGNGAPPAPEIALQVVLINGQVLLNESPGEDIRKLKMLAAASQAIIARIEAGKTPAGLIVPTGGRPNLKLG